MRIPVFAIAADPAVAAPFVRKSVSYCEAEIAADRARRVDDHDIRQGIQLLSVNAQPKTELRGSREQSGCLTANESHLNAQYFGQRTDISLLAREYEHKLEKHLLAGRKGTPRSCGVIAARVKTILSSPDHVHL